MEQQKTETRSITAEQRKRVEEVCFRSLALIGRNCEYLEQHFDRTGADASTRQAVADIDTAAIQLAAPLLQLPVLPPGHPVKLPQQPFQLGALDAVAPLAELLQRRAAAAAMALYQKHRPLLQLIKLPDKLLRRQIRQLAAKHHGIITDTLPQLCQQLFAAAKAGAVNGGSLLLQITLLDTQFFQIIACKGDLQLGCSLTVHAMRRLSRLPARQLSGL